MVVDWTQPGHVQLTATASPASVQPAASQRSAHVQPTTYTRPASVQPPPAHVKNVGLSMDLTV